MTNKTTSIIETLGKAYILLREYTNWPFGPVNSAYLDLSIVILLNIFYISALVLIATSLIPLFTIHSM